MMKIEKIYIGGWFQRTTLHLTEVYDFLHHGHSEIPFPKEELEEKRKSLGLTDLERVNGPLEYLDAKTSGLGWRMYEDGLIVLERNAGEKTQEDFEELENYYDKVLSPAISYIFSKGAPVPKELANIKTLLPFILTVRKTSEEEVKEFLDGFGERVYSQMAEDNLTIYKSAKIIIIVSEEKEGRLRLLVESQIFFREFKTQLHRYLNIHRLIWEEIAAIKEQGKVAGTKIRQMRAKLDDYQKTIKLIDSRINQMDSYLKTRSKIYVEAKLDRVLDATFAYKYETLADTLAYIKNLWKMTDNYLTSAIQLFTELQAESTKTSISSLQLITTIGVVAGLIGYVSRDQFPTVTVPGAVFLILLLIATWALNRVVTEAFVRKTYIIKKDPHKHMSW